MSLINWLKSKPTPRYYWCGRAGYGVLQESKTPIAGSLGLLRFDDSRASDELWAPFGESRFIVPKELRLDTEQAKIPCLRQGFCRQAPNPSFSFDSAVEQALSKIQSNQLEKLVLAQRRTLISPHPINPFTLLERLQAYFPNAHHFLYEPEPGLAFVGASPEQLYQRSGSKIQSEAQAGTRIRGQTPQEDQLLGQELLDSPKDHREHQIVIDNILSALEQICLDYGITEAKHICKLPNVQHLKTKLAGILKNSVCDQEILAALHPTAAVCGWPIAPAFDTLRQLEGFDRGFYTGALGYVSDPGSEFNVAIRGAVIKNCELIAFAGAGIVAGSNAQDEQQEIDNKMAFWGKLL